jgi:tetratricopeptide (TPR) repeat protein
VADEPTADAIRRRLTACGDGDHSAVLAEEAVADACRLAAERDPGELNSALLVAQVYWARYVLREPGPGADEADEADLAGALRWYAEIFPWSPEYVPHPLQARLAATLPPLGDGPPVWGDEAARYLASGSTRVPEVADRAVQLLEAAVTGAADNSDRARYLVNLCTAHLERHIAGGDLRPPGDRADLDRAVQAGEAAVRLAARLEPDARVAAEAVLCGALRTRFDASGGGNDLTAAVAHGRAALARCGADGPLPATVRSTLATALQARYGHAGDPADLDEAITLGALSVDGVPADRDRAGRLTNLANSYRLRYLRTGRVPDLDEAIRRGAAAVESAGQDPASAGIRGNLAMGLLDRFELTGAPPDLDEAIALARSAVELIPDGHPQRPGLLANLSTAIRNRTRVRASADDRDEAVRLAEMAVAAALPDDPSLPTILSALGLALTERFNATGDDKDLGPAVDATQRAVALLPATSPDRTRCLSGLSDLLRRRFERRGAQSDIDAAIECGLAAVADTPAGHVQRPIYLSHLANALHGRFEHSGTSNDLDHAISIARRAAADAQEDDPDRGYYLVNLGGFLTGRYVREGRVADIQESIVTGRAAVAALGADRLERVVALSNLSSALARRFSFSGDNADLLAAVDLADEALAGSGPGHPLRGRYASNLGVIRLLCYERDGREETLAAALAAATEAVRCTPADSLYLGARIGNRAEMLASAYARDHDRRSLDQALALFAEGAATETAPVLLRARLGRAMARLAGRERLWPTAARAWAQVLDQLPALTDWHLLSRDRQEHLELLSGLGPEAAAVQLRLGSPEGAWQAFEAGRGVLVNQALQTHADVTALQARDGELCERFVALRAALNATDGEQDAITLSVSEQNRRATARRAAAAEWAQVIASVRRLPGLTRFGLPPDPAELREAGANGAIVALGVTELGADVLLLTREGADSFRLDGVDHATAMRQADAFLAAGGEDPDADEETRRAVLSWLWEAVCEPVLRRLGHTAPTPAGEPWPRVWWIPAGPLSVLPVHAAVLDRVISSYTPSVSALVQARRRVPSGHVRGLAVAVPTVPGLPILMCAEAEAEAVARALGVTPLLGADATAAAITAALGTATHAHFACHALTDPHDPGASCLMLTDGRLSVRDLAPVVASDGYLAYLSACGTAFGGSRLVNESVHIASALHVAGFAHVIGTLWPVDDAVADQLARGCYELLAAGHDPAAALHAAVRGLRDVQPDHPALWASHVHVGPLALLPLPCYAPICTKAPHSAGLAGYRARSPRTELCSATAGGFRSRSDR